MRKIVQNYHNSSIFFRLSSVISLVFLLLLIITLQNYHLQKSHDDMFNFRIVNQTNHQMIKEIDDFLCDLSNISKQPLVFKRENKTNPYMNKLIEFNETGHTDWEFQVLNEQIFDNIMIYKSAIDSCYIFNSHGDADYKSKTPIFGVLSPKNEPWFQECIDRFGKPLTIDTYEFPYTAYKADPLYVFGLARGIVQIETSSVIGILLINVPVSYFTELFDNMRITPNHRIMLLHDDYIIYDTDTSQLCQTAAASVASASREENETFVPLKLDGIQYLASSASCEFNNWKLISLIPEQELYADLKASELRNLIVTLLSSIFALAAIALISRQIILPLRNLSAMMKQVAKGDFDVQVQVTSEDEVGNLTRSFNSMTTKINTLIETVYKEQISKGELELQMLQAQINPHFLYNTLESISMMAIINDDDTTSDMAQNLGTILRYSISKHNQEMTVGDELNILGKYIALQDIRFSAQYAISIEVPEEFYDIPTIKMILQPIVENAIYHGMSGLRQKGQISVLASRIEPDTLQFEVRDNGIGMSEEDVQKLNDYINDRNSAFKSIGLRNVNKRIKLRYGDTYGVRITSVLGEGTSVYVTIPCSRTSKA